MANELQVSDGRPEGTKIGQSAADLVAFHGATPVAQASVLTPVGTTAATSSSPVGFSTTTQANDIVTQLNAVILALKNKGILAAS